MATQYVVYDEWSPGSWSVHMDGRELQIAIDRDDDQYVVEWGPGGLPNERAFPTLEAAQAFVKEHAADLDEGRVP
jgi:hypothetical protein